jgi:cyclohexyl-isocyanide hydratase
VRVPTCSLARYHADRDRITGGGMTSGIDEALAILARLDGPAAAKRAQLLLQYQPAPPFADGLPDAADPAIYAAMVKDLAPLVARATHALKGGH